MAGRVSSPSREVGDLWGEEGSSLRGTDVSLYAGFMNNLIDVIGRHAGLCSRRSDIQDLAGKFASFAHSILPLGVENLDLVSVQEGSIVLGVAVFPPYGVGDGLGEGSVLG